MPARKPAALLLRQLRRDLVEAGEDLFGALRIRVQLPDALQRVLMPLGTHRPHRVIDQANPVAEIREISHGSAHALVRVETRHDDVLHTEISGPR